MKHVNTQNLQHTLQGIKGIIHHGEISIDRDELPHGSTGVSHFSMNELNEIQDGPKKSRSSAGVDGFFTLHDIPDGFFNCEKWTTEDCEGFSSLKV